jgi:predicted dienelactone hydrolase
MCIKDLKHKFFYGSTALVIALLFACGRADPELQTEIVTAPAPFPLAETGPYLAGNSGYLLIDESRDGREIRLTIWYPAQEQVNDQGRFIAHDAPPDMSASPYPLVLTDANSGDLLFSNHLVSHGFVMAIVRFPDRYENWDMGVIDHPRDMLFALDQIASNPPDGLEGVIDTNLVGVAGYSWGGFNSLAVSGVRIDSSSYLAYCDDPSQIEHELPDWYLEYACELAANWVEFEAYVGDEITAGQDGLWQPITDSRIRAVMPMAPDGAWLYGERGLAMVDRPVFIIEGGEDEQAFEAEYIFNHLGAPNSFMVSFPGKGHEMVFENDPAAWMRHFAVAFFGYYLQGREDYTHFFSAAFVSEFDDLVWMVRPEE